ncbi:protein-L-isoaspartate(D-aspartate) O-methyltransferase [Helicobacter marmotae]|uniref:Protein-L-isoaspartate O-methyltransferase n=1 Tax=Helicobacter marmotae TaxID=152490 RepID=A0A3D8I3G1_9HELI|nr:protein-L-isoaspartate(D-aspartate) O-methyltransferase [Helicobacter marmotae]RDU59526.1 protein-L-isoaspartate(D-aspartate) O-methyltransferase [Helicobacter marmotae]
MYKFALKEMCNEIQKLFPLSPKVAHAICVVDREKFIPAGFARHLAYNINPLPLCESQYISSPLTVAQMTEYLSPNGGDSVLEIGCGSGYQAMVLSHLFRRVFSIERIDKLLSQARERFKLLGAHNIFIKLDDGQKGWQEYAPFDAILFSACIGAIPQPIINQLQEGGVIVAPILEGGRQVIKRFRKHNGILGGGEFLGECLFVDVKDGVVR